MEFNIIMLNNLLDLEKDRKQYFERKLSNIRAQDRDGIAVINLKDFGMYEAAINICEINIEHLESLL